MSFTEARLPELIGTPPRKLLRYLIGLLVFLACLLARVPLAFLLRKDFPYIFFFPGVVLSSWLGGVEAGLLTTALSVIAAVYSLRSAGGGLPERAVLTTVLFVCLGSFVSWLNHAFRKSEYHARQELLTRKEYEQALRKSEERLNLALDAGGGVGVWDWDVLSDRIYADSRFAQLYSLDADLCALGVTVATFTAQVHPEDRPQVSEAFRRATSTAGEFAEEYRLLKEDGSVRWVYARGRCHSDENGRAFRCLGVVFDITARKETEGELRRANRQLEEFAYVASHDLQEPLRIVNLYTQLILKELGNDRSELNQYGTIVREGVTRMHALIQDLLTFSRTLHATDLPEEEADLNEAVSQACFVLKDLIADNGATVRAGRLPQVSGNTAQMALVFQNLLSNSLKYRSKEITPEIQIAAESESGHWIISVRDNGIGFDPKHAARIFGLFKRLHRDEYPGTGLGLAICQRIIERHGGRIWAESQPGKGAIFRFTLSCSDRLHPAGLRNAGHRVCDT
jgi:signal transduction histidine kinase